MHKKHLWSLATVLLAMLLLPVSPARADEAADAQVLQSLSRAISRTATDVKPAVVSVYTTHIIRRDDMPGIPGLPFDFGPFGPQPRRERPDEGNGSQREFRRRGLGSGFIVNADEGHIITNNHVIADAEDIKVQLADDREYEATVVGADHQTDIAVIKIDAPDLKALELGDSDEVEVGEFVLAVGSPFGLRQTVSFGIISGKGRGDLGLEDYGDFIQTDAAINRGNSGGPLVDVRGRVVGVNTAIASRTGGSVGVGFAIPVNMAHHIATQLIETGEVTRGWLGVGIQDLTSDMAEQFGLDRPSGALVTQIFDDTPAAEAGLEPGDIIVEFDGTEITNVSTLRNTVAAIRPDTEVELAIIRDGERKALTATIGQLSEDALAHARGETTTEELGMSVRTLDPEMAEELGTEQETGVVVTAVQPDSPAAEQGIGPGAIILQVNRQPVATASEFRAALREADLQRGVLLLVVIEDQSRFVVLKSEN